VREGGEEVLGSLINREGEWGKKFLGRKEHETYPKPDDPTTRGDRREKNTKAMLFFALNHEMKHINAYHAERNAAKVKEQLGLSKKRKKKKSMGGKRRGGGRTPQGGAS